MEHRIQILLATLGLCGWWLFYRKRQQLIRASAEHIRLEEQFKSATTSLGNANEAVSQYVMKLQELREENIGLVANKATLEERARILIHEQDEKKSEIEALKQSIITELSAKTNQFLLDKASEIGEISKNKVEPVLTQIFNDIEAKKIAIEAELKTEKKEVMDLKTAVQNLSENSSKFAKNADAVITTLRGSNRHQGSWGECILENLLSTSGLRQGHEYELRDQLDDDIFTRRKHPDVTVNLPEDKFIIIDSKAQFDAWYNYSQSTDPSDKESAIKGLIASFKAHIKNLSSKEYFQGSHGKTAEFVLMFVPIEAAYLFALDHDNSLFEYSWSKNVIIVGPTNLFATLKMIHLIWKLSCGEQNAKEILKNLDGLLKQAQGIVEVVDKAQKNFTLMQENFDKASKKLIGRQGIIPTIKRLQQANDIEVSAEDFLIDEEIAPLESEALPF